MRFALLGLFVSAFVAQAQTPLGTVTGLASDPSGSAIPNASIALTSEQTGVKRTAATNESGIYSFPNLPPGSYKLGAEAKGFRPLETPVFQVDAFRTIRQDLRFEISAAATEVVVTEAASAVVQTENPAIGSSLTTKQLIETPTNLRNVSKNSGDSALISSIMPLTVPGVVQVGGGAKWLTPGAGATGIKVKVDGIETSFGNFGSPDNVSQPSLEAVQEFTANVLTTRAEFGGMGTVTTVTKAGTNDFHGDLFWYARNSAFDARNTFQPTKPNLNLHNYGVSVGGPILKDKTFFQFNFDGTRGVSFYSFAPNVPTLAMREGDFTGQGALRNPFTDVNPFSGNRILPQFISPQARRAQEIFYPLPNFGPPTLTAGNYRASFNGHETHRLTEIRLDHNFSARHMAFVRYANKKDEYEQPGARSPLPPTTVGTSDNVRRVNFWTLGDVYSIRPNLFNEFRAGVVILVSASSGETIRGQQVLEQIGIQGLPNRGNAANLPGFSITGISGNNIILLNPVNDGHAQFADNLTWIRGRHSMKFGIEQINWFVNRYMPNSTSTAIFGSYGFTNRFTGNPYADFLLGLPTSVTRQEPYAPQYNRFRDWAFYGQDDFKVTPRLTLMYGLRYEYNGPAYALNDNLYSFDLASGSIVIPSEQSRRYLSPLFPSNIPIVTGDQLGLGRSLRNADKNNFAPRFGFSYALDSSARTVIRGGWGVYYSHLSGNVTGAVATGPYAASLTITNSIVNGQPLFTLANPFTAAGTPGTLNLTGIAPRLLNSYAQQYSLSLEREITRDIGVRVSYIGSKATQLPYQRNVNQPPASTTPFAASRRPYPLFNNINYADNGANMLYSGLQTQVHKRFSKGLLFTSTWTWAKELSDTDDTGDFELNTVIENAYDRRRDRGNVYSVPRHNWQSQALYELPGTGPLRGGWQLNVLFNVASGNFLTPVVSGPDPTNTNTTTIRPDVAGEIALPHNVEAWYDRNAFSVPPNGRFGNAGRGIIEGPGYVLLNFGVQKTVRMERFGAVQVNASFHNVLNHTNLGEPNMTANNVNGGRITATHVFPPAGSARTGQLGLRWSF